MRRVLFLQSQTYFGADSGIQALLMRHFDRSEVEVHVACNHRDDPQRDRTAYPVLQRIPDIHLRPTDFGPTLFARRPTERWRDIATQGPILPAHLLRLARYIRQNKIEIIHGTEKPRDAFYGVLLSRLTRARSVVHMHVVFADWIRPHVRWALRHADAVVGVSGFVGQTLIEKGGCDPQRVHAVVNALDLTSARWSPDFDAGQQVRRELGVAPDTVLVGICARMFKWKGHADLIAAVAQLRGHTPRVQLMIVGEDDVNANPGGGSYRGELEQQIAALGMGEQVIFTGYRSDIPRLMNAFDLYAMPSFEEPLGMVYLEAMATGKPVVAYQSGGVPEVVVDGKTGYLTPTGDIGALAQAIRGLAQDPDKRRAFGEAGRQRVLQEFNPQRMCHQMLDVYSRVLACPAPISSATNLPLGERRVP